MKLSLILFGLLSLVTFAFAWSKEDYEIFDLVSAVEKAEGPGTTFYSWLEVSPKATLTEIGRAYRKKSMDLHPDKNPGVKGIHERFARLGVVTAILRNPEGRTRYDFFYKNGVPKWRGTGYYYSRYRPGLGSVLVFIVLVTSGVQSIVQRINHKKDLERINSFVAKARTAAWGNKLVPQTTAKKVKVSLGGRDGEDRFVEMLVDGDHVYLLGDDEPVLLDASVAPQPSIFNTWAITLVRAIFQKAVSRNTASSPITDAEVTTSDEDTSEADVADVDGSRRTVPAAASVAGGRRRKAVPKKR